MNDAEQLFSNQSDTIRRLYRERDDARTDAAGMRRRAERAEAQLREVRAAHAAQLHGDWTDANPAVRELRNDVEWDRLGLSLVIRDGKGCVERDGVNLSLCAWSPDEVLAWVDGYETAARAAGSVGAV